MWFMFGTQTNAPSRNVVVSTYFRPHRDTRRGKFSLWLDGLNPEKLLYVCGAAHLGPEHGAVQLAGALLVSQLELQRSQSGWGSITRAEGGNRQYSWLIRKNMITASPQQAWKSERAVRLKWKHARQQRNIWGTSCSQSWKSNLKARTCPWWSAHLCTKSKHSSGLITTVHTEQGDDVHANKVELVFRGIGPEHSTAHNCRPRSRHTSCFSSSPNEVYRAGRCDWRVRQKWLLW